jgi:hypothetical protein
MQTLNIEYLKGLLQKRKDLLRQEVKQMIVDKLTPLDTIRSCEAEMELIDTQHKALRHYETE